MRDASATMRAILNQVLHTDRQIVNMEQNTKVGDICFGGRGTTDRYFERDSWDEIYYRRKIIAVVMELELELELKLELELELELEL
ncbi:hypothetical protein Tco_1413022 [Tanacetum coccineum]